jgi:hypothetical protein
MSPRQRRARFSDIEEIAMSLPEVATRSTWGDRPAYAVRGKNFVIFREPRPDAIDADTGERMDDVVVVMTPDQSAKEALVQDDGPWFTTPHFNGYNAVLLRQRDLGDITRGELEEVITDAWAARAPKRLAREHLGEDRP